MRYLYIHQDWHPDLSFYGKGKGTKKTRYYDETVISDISPDFVIRETNFGGRGRVLDRPIGYDLEAVITGDRSIQSSIPDFAPGDTLIFMSIFHFAVPLYDDQLINKLAYCAQQKLDLHFYDERMTLKYSEPDEYLYGQEDTLIKLRGYVASFGSYRDEKHRSLTGKK
jgi:hypothetical protein